MSGMDDRQKLRGRFQPVSTGQLHEQRRVSETTHPGVRMQLHVRLYGHSVRPAQAAVMPYGAVQVRPVHTRPQRSISVRVCNARLRGSILRDRTMQPEMQIRLL